ncbi:MAG TPA: VPLPA-CTERM sorting domain-containing protein [Cellvibrionaceae bacterium]|nr:VPLPA-CTERM sorting domain-containing protein [Cellvibrionaceae bacterium]
MSKIIKRSKQLALAILSTTSFYAPQIIALPYNYYQATRIGIADLYSYEIELADINNNGTVVATANYDAYIYKNGVSTKINNANQWTTDIHINDKDQVAGTISLNKGFFYEDGSFQDIGNILPIRINNDSKIIGKQNSQTVTYLNGTVATLDLPNGVTAVNSANNAAGTDANGQAFTYINGEKQIINKPPHVDWISIKAMNDENKVIGQLTESKAFLIDNDTITTFEPLETRNLSYLTDINANGTIVGTSYDRGYSCDHFSPECLLPNNFAAFMIEDGVITNLTGRLLKQDAERGVKITKALAINDFNFIVAQGFETGKGEAFYLLTPTPVPLPASAWLFLSGLSIFGALRRLARKV